MKNDVPIKNGIVIPGNEIEIATSRAGGPGGQHVNKTDTRITLRWNVYKTTALADFQKERLVQNLHARLTNEGDFLVHNSESRSQEQNKQAAFAQLAQEIRRALYVPKKRMATRKTHSSQERRLQHKTRRSDVKKMRRKSDLSD